jgi:t-SNARE complex subunit (syntaxin)
LTDIEKQFLLNVGKAAALKFLHARNLALGPSDLEVTAAHNEAEACRKAVIEMRARRKKRRLVWFFSFVLFAACIYLVFRLTV